jgi:hypothetical protein
VALVISILAGGSRVNGIIIFLSSIAAIVIFVYIVLSRS